MLQHALVWSLYTNCSVGHQRRYMKRLVNCVHNRQTARLAASAGNIERSPGRHGCNIYNNKKCFCGQALRLVTFLVQNLQLYINSVVNCNILPSFHCGSICFLFSVIYVVVVVMYVLSVCLSQYTSFMHYSLLPMSFNIGKSILLISDLVYYCSLFCV